jgi:hypothetical protein
MNAANPAKVHPRLKTRAAAFCSWIFLMTPVLAHPGHGFFEQGPRHWVSSPDHALVVAGFSLMLWVVAVTSARPVVRRWAYVGCIAGMFLAAALDGIAVA